MSLNTLGSGVRHFERIHFTKQELIGSGSGGHVYSVAHALQGAMAMKLFMPRIKPNESTLREIEHIRKLSHPHIIRFFGYVVEKINNEIDVIGYTMELMVDKSLHEVIHNDSIAYNIVDVSRWGRQASLALAFLHSEGIIHRDVKPHNMLLFDARQTLKLCDFGSTRDRHDRSMSAGVGTFLYMAPELQRPFETVKYSEKCDVYSMGISLWEMVTRRHPNGAGGQYSNPPVEIDSSSLKEIIRPCCYECPDARPTMLQLSESLNESEELSIREASLQPEQHPTDPFNSVERNNRIVTGSTLPNANLMTLPDAELARSTQFTSRKGFFSCVAKTLGMKRITEKTTMHDTRITGDDVNCASIVHSRRTGPTASEPIVRTLNTFGGFVTDLSLNGKRNMIAAIYNGRAKILDLNGTEDVGRHDELFKYLSVERKPLSRAFCLDWSSSGDLLAIGYEAGTMSIFTFDGKLRNTFETTKFPIRTLKWNGDVKILVVIQGHVLLCDANKGTVVARFADCCVLLKSLAWISEDTFTTSDTRGSNIWRVGFYEPLRIYKAEYYATVFKYDPVSKLMASIYSNHASILRVSSPGDDRPLLKIKTNKEYVVFIEWSQMGNILARFLSVSNQYVCRFWDARNGKTWSLREGNPGNCGAFSPDGKYIVSANTSTAGIWNVETGYLINRIDNFTNIDSALKINNIFWNQSDDKIVALSGTGPVVVLDFPQA